MKDSSGKVCIIADLTVAFSVEYKSNGQKEVWEVSHCLCVACVYKMLSISVCVWYLNFEQISETALAKIFPPSSYVASVFIITDAASN